jgi:hypothetical protein
VDRQPLHEFASGEDFYHHLAEHYLCPFQADEGETGVPEEDVRLDEVLARPGDKLWYQYDFGDDWMHLVKLEAERPRDDDAPRAVCTDGRRPGPSEDCSGVHGYESIVAALDPGHPEHAEAVAEYSDLYGGDADPADYAPTPFDLGGINKALADPSGGRPELLGPLGISGPLGELTDAIRYRGQRDLFQQLIEDADLDGPIDIDADTAAQMVSPYSWLLDRVGADGIKLTGAGYLPPLALWWHLAERMPVASKDAFETQADLILLATLAAQSTDNPNKTIAEILTAIGWMDFDGTPVPPTSVGQATWATSSVLRRLGAYIDEPGVYWSDKPTPQGITFARAALRTWPS